MGNGQGKDGEPGAECGDVVGRVGAHHLGSYNHFYWHSASFTAVSQMCPKAGPWTLCQGECVCGGHNWVRKGSLVTTCPGKGPGGDSVLWRSGSLGSCWLFCNCLCLPWSLLLKSLCANLLLVNTEELLKHLNAVIHILSYQPLFLGQSSSIMAFGLCWHQHLCCWSMDWVKKLICWRGGG